MTQPANGPTGEWVSIIDGQKGFVPNPLPHQLNLGSDVVYHLDEASRAIGTLAGVGETLPNPHLLIRPFVRREAVLSSKIEGTQASLTDLYLHEVSPTGRAVGDVAEVANYVRALERGLELLEELPICLRLVNEMHSVLMRRLRGSEMRPGELREAQNWIGAPGTPIHEAQYVPPPPSMVRGLLEDWERFVNLESRLPPLVQCALMHYQFEAIHPYLDGNGRVGRLLITLFLCARGILSQPLLYLSAYFEHNRDEYYAQLQRVTRTGNWTPWLVYFLSGISEQSHDALLRIRRVRRLHEDTRSLLQHHSGNTLRLLDLLFERPLMTVPVAAGLLGLTSAGTRRILDRLADLGIVDVHRDSWPRLYVARQLLSVIDAATASG